MGQSNFGGRESSKARYVPTTNQGNAKRGCSETSGANCCFLKVPLHPRCRQKPEVVERLKVVESG